MCLGCGDSRENTYLKINTLLLLLDFFFLTMPVYNFYSWLEKATQEGPISWGKREGGGVCVCVCVVLAVP